MNFEEIIETLQRHSHPEALDGMARFGIPKDKNFGVRVPVLREIARHVKRQHALALRLWQYGYRETRILASMLAEPTRTTPELMEQWVECFHDWEICDQCCMNLFDKLPDVYDLALRYSERTEEFARRTGYVLMARMAVSDKKSPDERFLVFFPAIQNGASDPRNFVKKAVNWALRQIGKRNVTLNCKAIDLAQELLQSDEKSARWVASDALRELQSPAVQTRLKKSR